jgi:hypothetical protein
MGKLVKVGPYKAFKIEAIQIGEQQLLSVRQMYATKKDPTYKPAKQGITIPIDVADKIAKYIKDMANDPTLEFKEIEVRKRGAKDVSDE